MTVAIFRKCEQGLRLSEAEAMELAMMADLNELGLVARARALKKNGPRAAYLIDRNINYTNICAARCSFCAFYRPKGHKEGYDLSYHEIDAKIKETLAMGGTRILMQGGLNPDHTIDTYINLIQHIKQSSGIHIHALSPPEVHHVATKAGLTYTETLARLKEAGLASMPGGGAEILVDKIRDPIAVGKCSVDQWLEIMREAHLLGVQSTATMMLGHIESWEDRFEHLRRIRQLQDETGGFISFIPWTFQPENTPLHPKIKRNKNVHLASAYEYLRFLAISRLYLDNFDHIQVSLLTQGAKIAQIGLHFGSDDLGSLLIEENVVRLAGRPQEADLERSKMQQMIREAGFVPYERDTYYNEIQATMDQPARVVV